MNKKVYSDPRCLLSKTRKFADSNPNKNIPLTTVELETVMKAEVLTMLYSQELFGGFSEESYSQYLDRMDNRGDSSFSAYFGRRFVINGVAHNAEDINYYYLGFITAASNRSMVGLKSIIAGYNFGQAVKRFDMYDIRQIGPAKMWANRGYNFYNETLGD